MQLFGKKATEPSTKENLSAAETRSEISFEAYSKELDAFARQNRGRLGEAVCCWHLKEEGYRILKRNWRVGHKEIDIIAEDDKYIVFVEVKTRTEDPYMISKYGTAASAVTADKLHKIRVAANAYLAMEKPQKTPRVDVMEVFLLPTGDKQDFVPTRVHHMRNVRENGKYYGKKRRR